MKAGSLKEKGILAFIFFVILVACLPLFRGLPNINANLDWLQMLSYYRADRQAVLEHGQWPLRTHFFGGGYPLIANPQDGSLSPFFLPVLVFGESVGMKVNVFLAHLIAAFGMYYLTRRVLGFPLLGALFSVVVFCLGGHMHRILIRGQDYVTLYYFFLPLVLALFIRARESRRFLALCAFVLTIVALQAGLYFVPIVFFLFLWACLHPAYLKYFFFACCGALLLGALKFLPMLELLSQNPRVMGGYNPFWDFSLARLYDIFLARHTRLPFESLNWVYYYVGFAPVALGALAFAFRFRRLKSYLLLLGFFALLTFAGHTRLDVFRFLHSLPLFSSMEAPSRYFSPLVIFLVAVASGEAFFLARGLRPRLAASAGILLLVLTAADLAWINGTRDVSFPVPAPAVAAGKDFYAVKNIAATGKVSPLIPREMFETRSWEWTRPSQYELMLENTGKINAYVNIHLGEFAAPKFFVEWNGIEDVAAENYARVPNPEYRGEAYFLAGEKNSAVIRTFAPSAILVDVEVGIPDVLVVNQNYDKYWRADAGPVMNHNGLLAVRLDRTGARMVRFSYVPRTFYLGLLISLSAVLLCVIAIRRRGAKILQESPG